MTISLCIITGNEAAHIVRMLDSFAAGFDELSLVRAIGTATPDNTEQLAREWCADNGKGYVFGEYRNAADLTHVDDFAAARNLSFSRAGGDWLVWADCDDVCDDAARLRERAAEAGQDGVGVVRLPYIVPQSGKQTMRERLISATLFRSGARWHWPVHENFIFRDTDKVANLQSPTWIHKPDGPKAGGERRNLRILTAALRDAPMNYYYCHQEYFYLRDSSKAKRFGEIFLALPGGNPSMRYQCLLNMAEMEDNNEQATVYALRAHGMFPRQKEAIASLVRCAFQEDNAERATHWARMLFFSPSVPAAERLWCYEPKWDGWARFDLRARALRMAGDDATAGRVDEAMRDGKPPRIALLHATRGRVSRAIACRDAWLDSADRPELVEHIFAIDDDDADSMRWLRSFRRVISPLRNCVSAWNEAASVAEADLFVQLSDDWAPVAGWDTKLIEACGGRDAARDPFVIAVGDGHRTDDLLCMAILSRARWEQQGREVFSGEYESMYSDNEFSYRAFRDGIVVDKRNEIVFSHIHPAFGKAAMDKTYERQNAPEKYERGLATFNRRNPDVK